MEGEEKEAGQEREEDDKKAMESSLESHRKNNNKANDLSPPIFLGNYQKQPKYTL